MFNMLHEEINKVNPAAFQIPNKQKEASIQELIFSSSYQMAISPRIPMQPQSHQPHLMHHHQAYLSSSLGMTSQPRRVFD
jgi:hypothetical protein